MQTLRKFVPLLMLLAFANIQEARAQLKIGTFDASRGGAFSYGTSAQTSILRSDIQSSFPGAAFLTTPTLTTSFLSGVDVLMISVGTSNTTATTSLSAAEQAALLGFVDSGKGALIFTDNDTFAGGGSAAVNQSFLSPFGLHATGTLNGSQNATVSVPTASYVTNGPFGLVSSFGTSYPGYFDTLGPNAASLATLDANGKSALAVIPKGALAAQSGGVVFFSDSSLSENSDLGASDAILIENALGGVSPAPVPEASSVVSLGILLAFGLGGLAVSARRQKSQPAE